jgi:LCP family protein required for cell wall assembly
MAEARIHEGDRPAERPGRAPLTSALVAGLLSMLLPGLGQVLFGWRWRGIALLGATAVLVIAAAMVTAGGVERLLPLLVRPEALIGLLVGNVTLAVFRLFAALDAFLLVAFGRLDVRGRRLAGVAALGLVVVTVTPHVLVASYGWRTHELLTTVFVTDERTPEPEATRHEHGPEADDTLGTGAGEDPGAAAADIQVEVEVEVHERFPWEARDRLTVALVGSDAGPGRSGARADVLLVVSVELSAGAMAAVSIPRNLTGYPMPAELRDITDACPDRRGYDQISGLYACLSNPRLAGGLAEERYPDAPDAAARGVADTLEVLLDQHIDHYAVVDLGGFVDVVDAFGGVQVQVTRPIHVRLSPARDGDGLRTFNLPSGGHHLDGQHALAYVRSRTGSSDYDRMRRQRCLVSAMVDQTDTTGLLRALPSLVEVITTRVRTDVPIDALPLLVEVAGAVDMEGIGSLGLSPPGFQATDFSPRLEEIREAVAALFDDPVDAAEDVVGIASAQQNCR